MTTSNSIIKTEENGFLLNEKETWFKYDELTNYFNGITPEKDNYLYLSSFNKNIIQDKVTILSFQKAIESNSELFKDKIILDINNNLGLYSMMCAKVGAKKVYCIQENKLYSEYSKLIIKNNNLDKIINVINDNINNLKQLPDNEKVDIIICEWFGYFLLLNSKLKSIIYARDNFLKENGIIFPDKGILYLCAMEDYNKKNKFEFNHWDINFNCMSNIKYVTPLIEGINNYEALSSVCPIFKIDIYNIKYDDINFSNEFELIMNRDGYFQGFFAFFDIEFTKVKNYVRFNTSPFNIFTKYYQCLFYIKNDYYLKEDDVIKGSICCVNDKKKYDTNILNIKILFHINVIDNKNENNIKEINLYKLSI
jgi:protein arginine N-methyltransferase 1